MSLILNGILLVVVLGNAWSILLGLRSRKKFIRLCGVAQANADIYKELVDELRKGGAK